MEAKPEILHRYDLFLSYARADQELVSSLVDYLREKEKLVWIDHSEIPASSLFQREILRGIDLCDSFAIVLTKSSSRSQMCSEEYKYALHREKHIVPIRIGGTISPPETEARFPELQDRQFLEIADPLDDASRRRILAAIDYDAAWRDEATAFAGLASRWQAGKGSLLRDRVLERAERWIAGAAAHRTRTVPVLVRHYAEQSRIRENSARRLRNTWATGLVVVFAILAAVSLWQMRVAENERNRAQANLGVADGAVDELFKEISQSELLNVPGLQPLRSRLLGYALDYRVKLIEIQTDDDRLKVGFAEDCLNAGVLALNLDRRDQAETLFRDGIASLDRQVRASATPRQWRLLGMSLLNLGLVQRDRGDLDGAAQSTERALGIAKRLAKSHPDESRFSYDLAKVNNHLAVIHQIAGRIPKALERYREAAELQKELADAQQYLPESLADLAGTYQNLSLLHEQQSQMQDASSFARKSFEIRRHFVGVREGEILLEVFAKTDLQHVIVLWENLADSLLRLGALQMRMGHFREALEDFGNADAVLARLVKENPAVPRYATKRVQSRIGASDASRRHYAAGTPTEIPFPFRTWVEFAEFWKKQGTTEGSPYLQLHIVMGYLRHAQLMWQQNRSDEARRNLELSKAALGRVKFDESVRERAKSLGSEMESLRAKLD